MHWHKGKMRPPGEAPSKRVDISLIKIYTDFNLESPIVVPLYPANIKGHKIGRQTSVKGFLWTDFF